MPEFRSLYLADAELPEVEILYTGSFAHGHSGDIKVTEADLDKAVANFDARMAAGQADVPIDFDHSHVEGQGSKAAGWVKALRREGDKLKARIEWTQDALAALKARSYRYFSPEFSENAHDEQGKELGFAILSGALTNRPFLKNLAPVAFSEAAKAEVQADYAPLLSVFADAITAQAREVVRAAETRANVADESTDTPVEPQDKAPDQAPKTVTLTESDHKALTEAAEKVTALSEQVNSLKGDLFATKTELNEERLSAVLSQARREGRIPAGEETDKVWTERTERLGLEGVKALLSEFPAETIPMTERGSGHDAPTVGTAPEGVDQEAFEQDAKVRALAAEKSISYTEALDQLLASGAVS